MSKENNEVKVIHEIGLGIFGVDTTKETPEEVLKNDKKKEEKEKK